jgi:monoamine oxidase
VRLADGSLLTMQDARACNPAFDMTRTWALPIPPDPDHDSDLESYLRAIGFTDEQLTYTRRSWGNAAGDDIARLSAQAAYEDMTDTSAGDGDFRILEGYDRLPVSLAEGLDIRLNTVVTRIDWAGDGVRVQTADGQVFPADRVLITVPLGVLQAGAIAFDPPLPTDKQDALRLLIMGGAIKMVYAFDQPVLPPGIGALYSAVNPPMWWSPSAGRDVPGQVVTAFTTGEWARALRGMGADEALAHGLRALADQLGTPLPTPRATRFQDWNADPFALGGYSTVGVGGREARGRLAQPIVDRLYFAGEATAPNAWGGTVHGAYASGRRAALEIIAQLSSEPE